MIKEIGELMALISQFPESELKTKSFEKMIEIKKIEENNLQNKEIEESQRWHKAIVEKISSTMN